MRISLGLVALLAVVVLGLARYLVPKNTELGQALERSGRLDEALGYYMDALRTNPADEPTWVRVASVYQMRGDPFKAIDVYRHLTELDSTDLGYRRQLALLYDW